MDGSVAQLQPGHPTSYGNDGDVNTWTQAYGQYRWQYQIDLGAATSIGRVSIVEPADRFATAFHIDVSVDGSTFTTVSSVTGLTAGGSQETTFSSVSARYVRVVADAPNADGQTGGQMAISEIGIYA